MADFRTNRPVQERVNDILIYILGQKSNPTFGNWWDAIDDLFDNFDYDEKLRIIEFATAMLRQVREPSKPEPMLLLTDQRKDSTAK